MRTILMRYCVVLLLPWLPSQGLAANDISPKDFDLACAITAGAKLGTNPENSDISRTAFALYTFYLGRLSARDDNTVWHAVVMGRVAELRLKALSAETFKSCMNFYMSKIE